MVFHHRKSTDLPAVSSRVETVRLLECREDLQAAVEKVRDFERKGVAVYARRVGNYERSLNNV
jgi:hypothetical protein